MNYIQWNNVISSYFFNTSNAGKSVYLYLTKGDIIHLAKQHFQDSADDAIWVDFIKAIKCGLHGSAGNIIEKSRYTYNKRFLLKINNDEISYPLYITYLVFLILPLTTKIEGSYNAINYYDRLNDFLATNQIKEKIGTSDFRNNQFNLLWGDLSDWANGKKKGDLGMFLVIPFTNTKWIYVGKIFSQCIFPPKSIRRLPELFLHSGMIPDSNYSNAELKRFILQNGSSILGLSNNTLDSIRKDENDELGRSIIETVRREYTKWTGESHTTDGLVPKRNDVTSRIYLQMQPFDNEGRVKLSFRIRSINDFPEDLTFNGLLIKSETNNFSKTIYLPFKSSFQLRDNFNKWVAKFLDKDIYLFVGAGTFQLSSSYWLETDNLIKANWMYLMFRNSTREKIYSWISEYCSKFEDQSDFEGVPAGYSLFKILDPNKGLDNVPELTFIKEKRIEVVDALAVNFRTLTDDFMPEVQVLNSDSTEKVYIQYNNSSEKYLLERKMNSFNRWVLPKEISLYADFNIKVDENPSDGDSITYKIVSSDESAMLLDDSILPIRDSFGLIKTVENGPYSVGSNTIGVSQLRQQPYVHLFRGIKEDYSDNVLHAEYNHTAGNILISYLSLKKVTTVRDFNYAFEFLYTKYYAHKIREENFNYSRLKRTALTYLDYLGFLDYDYETRAIVMNPPRFILIPSSKGRKVLFIGGRDRFLIKKIVDAAAAYNLQVEITQHLKSNEDLMLPDVITIRAFGGVSKNFGEKDLIAFATKMNIPFNPEILVQLSLQHFSASIMDYEKDLLSSKESSVTYDDWARYIFNENTFSLEKFQFDNFEKKYSLYEYRLTPWEFHHRLWVDDKCYSVDKNWGRYLVLKHHQKNAILYNKDNERVAIPVGLPLPRLLAESIMLLSGYAPEYRRINNMPYRIYENIPSIIIQNLFQKLSQQTTIVNF
ncbi:hypothetical protein [Dyadobacter sp. CY326]|uniref:hypothetical protein n=1 Tax=Dyadobacter sp. CY326 TaxID=2907300 RepID=UPI001F37F5EA|nr:hypothetical protein [Dyadobacter sp. CY326]MCE7066684.1 hypothetical protein [Dyadobacter sp. CY326]